MRRLPIKSLQSWSVPYQLKADELIILRIYHTRRKRPKSWQ
jgi:hypothetical protein